MIISEFYLGAIILYYDFYLVNITVIIIITIKIINLQYAYIKLLKLFIKEKMWFISIKILKI